MIKENLAPKILELIEKNNIRANPIENSNYLIFSCNKEDITKFIKLLKDSTDLRFALLTDLFAADFPHREKRFEITYNLLSLKLNMRIMIKVIISEEEMIPSVAKLFNAAIWYEREAYDMFGVVFEGNPDLRRILTDYGFIGHPLRKDFPLTGHVQVKYDEKLQQVIYEPVRLDQEFRNFEFLSPWQGPDYVLPGDEKATK